MYKKSFYGKFDNSNYRITAAEAVFDGVNVALRDHGFVPPSAEILYLDDAKFNEIQRDAYSIAARLPFSGQITMADITRQLHAYNYYRLSEKPEAPGWTPPGKGATKPPSWLPAFDVPKWAPLALLGIVGLVVFVKK